MNVQTEAAYAILESPSPERIDRYLGDVVGLMPGAAPGSWRVDDRVHRVLVRQGPRADAVGIGFEAVDERAFEATVERLRGIGVALEAGSADDCRERRVHGLVRMATPWGVELELVQGLERDTSPFRSAQHPRGFVTEGQGFGHFVFVVGDRASYEASRRFAIEGLGLRLSDWLRMPIGPDAELHVSFFHCNRRHHSLAVSFAPRAAGQRLHHLNFEVSHVDAVGHAFDRAVQTGTPIANTIGQHDNDRMVSFYSESPDGWRVEIGATGRVIDDDWSDVREYDRISHWGHQPPSAIPGLSPSSLPSPSP